MYYTTSCCKDAVLKHKTLLQLMTCAKLLTTKKTHMFCPLCFCKLHDLCFQLG